jgi:hypothetical protein
MCLGAAVGKALSGMHLCERMGSGHGCVYPQLRANVELASAYESEWKADSVSVYVHLRANVQLHMRLPVQG